MHEGASSLCSLLDLHPSRWTQVSPSLDRSTTHCFSRFARPCRPFRHSPSYHHCHALPTVAACSKMLRLFSVLAIACWCFQQQRLAPLAARFTLSDLLTLFMPFTIVGAFNSGPLLKNQRPFPALAVSDSSDLLFRHMLHIVSFSEFAYFSLLDIGDFRTLLCASNLVTFFKLVGTSDLFPLASCCGTAALWSSMHIKTNSISLACVNVMQAA